MRKTVLTVITLILTAGSLWGEVPTIAIRPEPLFDIPSFGGPELMCVAGGYIYIDGSSVFRINPETEEIKKYSYREEIWRVLGQYDDEKLIVHRLDDQRIFIYDAPKDTYTPLEGLEVGNMYHGVKSLYHYYGDWYLESSGQSFHLYKVNRLTGERIIKAFGLIALSPDKMHGISLGDSVKGIGILQIDPTETKAQLVDTMRRENVYFISNNLVGHQDMEYLYVYNLQGELLLQFRYIAPEYKGKEAYGFDKIRNSEYGKYLTGQTGPTPQILVKAPDEREYLRELGLLFEPTTARTTGSGLRVRTWPLLEAKHLAYLEEGEEVEVLERSGIKTTIGDREDYWYKIRRADGLEGWSYGAFLELEREQIIPNTPEEVSARFRLRNLGTVRGENNLTR